MYNWKNDMYRGEETAMKIFVSWSGELSKKIAEELKKWIPCIIQSATVFYSPEDIEKGERWNPKVLSELEETNYGIVCLTKENVNAPWINFEAGALAKNIAQSRVLTLLINLQPSEVNGPLSTFQATTISSKEDFWKLIKGINTSSEVSVDEKILETSYNALWDPINRDINKIILEYKPANAKKEKNYANQSSQILEELVQLVRNQNMLLNTPEALLPPEYIRMINENSIEKSDVREFTMSIFGEIESYVLETKNYEFGKRIGGSIARFISHNDLGKALYFEAREFTKKCDRILDMRRNTQNKTDIQRESNEKNAQAAIEEIFNMFQDMNNEKNEDGSN